MPRAMDDRPVASDKGYVERPRPPMNAFGVWVRRRILDERLAANYKASFDNERLVIGNLRDFLRAAQLLADASRKPLLLRRTADGLMFLAQDERTREKIGIEVRLENAQVLLESGVVKTAGEGQLVSTRPLTDKLIAEIIAGLIPRDPELLEHDG
jgi:hypothetical protein